MNKEKKTLLKLENAGFSKNNKWLVKGVSLEVRQGEIVTLIGPNGSGKTTTAKIALGIYKEIEGKVNKLQSSLVFSFFKGNNRAKEAVIKQLQIQYKVKINSKDILEKLETT